MGYVAGKELDFESQQIRETFACFGLASYQAQCMEKQIVILISIMYNPEFAKSTPLQRDEFFGRDFKKTLGRLISDLKTAGNIESNLEERLDDMVKKRNWLVHDYYWERAGEFNSIKGRDAMIDELIRLASEFEKLDADLTDIMDRWVQAAGAVTDDEVKARLQDLIDKGMKEE